MDNIMMPIDENYRSEIPV